MKNMSALTTYQQQVLDEWGYRSCDYCMSSDVKLRRYVTTSNVTQYRWICMDCGRSAIKGRQSIPHWVVEYWYTTGRLSVAPSEIPLLDSVPSQETCYVCGAPGAELHHFAPQALSDYFDGNVECWPKVYLCKYHHDLWHSVLTPWSPGVCKTAVAQEILRKYYGVR